MAKITMDLEKTAHRIMVVGSAIQVSSTLEVKFVERTIHGKQRSFLQVTENGVKSLVPLGDSKIPPKVY